MSIHWKIRAILTPLCLIVAIGVQSGCGGGDAPPEGKPDDVAATPESQDSKSNDGRVAGKSQDETAPKNPSPKVERAEQGTPEWYLREILTLRIQKFPVDDEDDVEKLKKHRRERNLKIVQLAEECIAKTHKNPELEAQFNAAVHQLLESRVDLALQGEEKDILALYDLADVLLKRDKESKAAADAAYKVAVFANTNAIRYPDQKSGWLTEFVRRARLFATDFPQEKPRAVRLLDVAGRSCELHGRTEDAVACYTKILKDFSDMEQAKRATAVLRRLTLAGKPLELKGPTIDGGYLNVKDFKGRVVLVAFWASDNPRSRETVPTLQTLNERYKKHGLEIIGVNLDREEPVLDSYLEKSNISFPQIFYADRNKRRWENLIAKDYAVRDLPTLWLVDQEGIVVSTNVDVTKLESKLQDMLRVRTASKKP